jgi:hypothetical protein
MLTISENLYLTHSFSAGEGKTKGMAKGFTLCHQNDVFAGECAGFGIPVIKADNLTIFPSLFSSHVFKPGTVETVYHMNLINTWQIMGAEAPPYFRGFMEQLVRFYMNRPDFQRSGLKIRNSLLKILRIQSTMKPDKSYGYCRVLYQTEDLQLKINVKGKALLHLGELILLNEVPGIGFSRLINRTESGWNIRDGNDFLPWQTCTIETAVENPCLHIGFFLSVPDKPDSRSIQIAAGREVGRALNWAGLSITAEQAVFTYHVNFYGRKNDWFGAMPIPYG